MNLGPRGDALIRAVERLELQAYMDVAKIWTIGLGHVIRDAHGNRLIGAGAESLARAIYPEGLTVLAAEHLFQDDLRPFVELVNARCGRTSQNQFDAMVSLCFNIGGGHFFSSTVLRDHIAGEFQGAADAFLLWDKAVDQETLVLEVVPGLLNRRKAERELYLSA